MIRFVQFSLPKPLIVLSLLLMSLGSCVVFADTSSADRNNTDTSISKKQANYTVGQRIGGPFIPDWSATETTVGEPHWCKTHVPNRTWALSCRGGLRVKVLTYNLFWWNLFGLRHGQGRRAGRLISATGWPEPYDIMGFQECDDVKRVIRDAGLQHQYATLQGPHALGIAYRLAAWDLISKGKQDIAEDRPDQWYGNRAVQWVRLKHRATGKTLFFVNHHGPLPLSTGGKCGGKATAFNILKLIADYSQHNEDDVLLVGDFNSKPDSDTVQVLSERMHRVFSGESHGGVDHIFSSCGKVVGTWNLGSGGSDHDALSTIIQEQQW